MEIKEVEKMLSVSRSNIRFYEKEGLLQPERKENNYRDYSEQDVAALKKIIALRKLGFSVKEIASMQKGELSLADAASANLRRLEKEMEDLKGAFKLTKAIAAENPSFEAFDQERWWGEITQAEHKGQRFVTICKDYLIYERSIFDSVLKHIFGYDFETARKKRGILIACGILLLLCIIRGISRVIFWHESFGDGFLYPFVLFLICSAISFPVYITGKNLQKRHLSCRQSYTSSPSSFSSFLLCFSYMELGKQF